MSNSAVKPTTSKTKLLDETADKDCYGENVETKSNSFIGQLLLLNPASFLAVNIVIPTLHILSYICCKFWLVPMAATVWVPMLQAAAGGSAGDFDYIRVAWTGVLFGFFMYWFTFAVSAMHASAIQKNGFDARVPRANNPARVNNAMAKRLYGAHENANEDFMIFSAAITCACVLQAVTVGSTTAACKEVAAMTVVHMLGRILHFLAYAADVPSLRALGYVLGLQTNAYIFAGAIFGAWTTWAQ